MTTGIEVLPVKEGTVIKMPHDGHSHKTAKVWQDVVIKPACETKDKGRWYCVTHDQGFWNQFEKDTHIASGTRHMLAWWCFEHGPEQP